MNYQKTFVFILFMLGFYNLYAGNPLAPKQFINQKDWNFVENKGQITPPNPLKGERSKNGDLGIKYYGHQGGVYLYCRPGMISFVFTKVADDENVSEATGMPAPYPLKGGHSPNTIGRAKSSALVPAYSGGDLGVGGNKITTSRADLVLTGSNPNAQIIASDQQEYYENFYTTGNVDSGITNVHTYKTLTYKDIYPNIDMILNCRAPGMEYSFIVYPGGKVSDIQMQWVGIEGIKTLKNLNIEYSCALGKMEESAPYSFVSAGPVGADPRVRPGPAAEKHGADTRIRPYTAFPKIESQFVLKNNRVGFNVGRYDESKILVIDPTLIWGTYYGGSGINGYAPANAGVGVSSDGKGNVYMAGTTMSGSDIATSGAYQTLFSGWHNAFLAKFDSSGALKWATYVGGSDYSDGYGVATDGFGNVYITGLTTSDSGVATSGAYQTSDGGAINSSGANDAFLAKFDGKGKILWGTYYGGPKYDYATAVTTDGLGNVYITGITSSLSGIATAGAYMVSYTAINNEVTFVAKFDSSGSLQWGTYFGGGSTDSYGIACDGTGNVYITGNSYDDSLITTNGAYQTKGAGLGDAFLAKFNGSGKIQWATYYGGPNEEHCNSVATDRFGNIYITGLTASSTGIATRGAYQASFIGPSYSDDGFLAKFNSYGAIQWATYYDENKTILSVATDRPGNVYITGVFNIDGNAFTTFVAGFSSAGSLQWETTCGEASGNVFTQGSGIAADRTGNIYVTGLTSSNSKIATSGAYQTYNSAGNGGDAFLIKFGPLDGGITSIFNPKDSLCPDSQSVKVQLHNFGINPFDSIIIKWSVNGKLQPYYHWKGNLAPGSSLIITLGNFLAFTGKDTVKSWTALPDGSADANPKNDTAITIMNVIPPPLVNTGPDKAICESSSTSIGVPGVNGDTYLWTSNPAGFSSTVPNPIVSPTQTTVYYLRVSVNATGCSNVDSVIITISPMPFVNTGTPKSVCMGDSAAIGGPAIAGYLYSWTSSPSGFSSSISKQTVAPPNSTLYTLMVTDTVTGCTNSASVLVTVKPLPIANVGQNVFQVCSGARVKIGGNAMPDLVYSWTSNPAGFSSTISNPVVMPATSTWYYLIVKDTATKCSNRDSASVALTASQAPVADAGPNQTICAGDSVPIGSHAVAGNKYVWTSNPSGFKSTFAIPIVKPDTITVYFLTVTNAAGCINFDSTIITVNPKPKLKPGMSQIICGDMAVQLGGLPDSGINYLWRSDPAGFSSTVSNPVDSPKTSTVYHLKETVSATGCTDSDSVTVTIVPKPILSFNINYVNGFEYLFTLKTQGYPAYMYHWNFGSSTGSDTATGYAVTHTYTQNGKYVVTLTFQLPGFCRETDTASVVVNEQFSLNIFPNPFPTQTDINYTLASPAHVKISLVDEIGQQVGALLDKQLSQGVYNTYFDARLWKTRPAMYFILFQLDNKLYVRKIIQLEDR